MTDLQLFFGGYAILGTLYTVNEHRSYEWDFTDMPKFSIALNMMQQVVHYTRFMLTWPLYLMEDVIIFLDNYGVEDEDDEE